MVNSSSVYLIVKSEDFVCGGVDEVHIPVMSRVLDRSYDNETMPKESETTFRRFIESESPCGYCTYINNTLYIFNKWVIRAFIVSYLNRE